jgi:hypothetical protein
VTTETAPPEAAADAPLLDAPYEIPEASIAEYRGKGHTCLRGLASPDEAAAWRPLLASAAIAGRHDERPLAERDTYGRAFLQVPNLWERDARTKSFVFARRFARAAAELMGVEGVRLYHDQALFKEPGGGHTPWHRDQFYWPLETSHTITLWMPLVDVPEEIGSMHFASGSHRLTDLGEAAIGDASDAHFGREVAERGLPVATHGALRAGDATFHAGWTLHRAEANPTGAMREVVTIIYFADGTRVGPLDHPNREFDQKVWLPGCAPGDLAASRKNPVLWSRETEPARSR